MFEPDVGLVSGIVHLIGLPDLAWTTDRWAALTLVGLLSVWLHLPFSFLILYSARLGVPNDLYESASIDGASGWQRFTQHHRPDADARDSRRAHVPLRLRLPHLQRGVAVDRRRSGTADRGARHLSLSPRLPLSGIRCRLGHWLADGASPPCSSPPAICARCTNGCWPAMPRSSHLARPAVCGVLRRRGLVGLPDPVPGGVFVQAAARHPRLSAEVHLRADAGELPPALPALAGVLRCAAQQPDHHDQRHGDHRGLHHACRLRLFARPQPADGAVGLRHDPHPHGAADRDHAAAVPDRQSAAPQRHAYRAHRALCDVLRVAEHVDHEGVHRPDPARDRGSRVQ